MNPLDLPGWQFLLFYVITLAVAIIVAIILRRALARSDETFPVRRITVDPYEAAYLRGGPRQAIETAVAVLVRNKALKASKTDRAISISGSLPAGAHWLEKAVHSKAGPSPGKSLDRIYSSSLMNPYIDRIADQLKNAGLVLSDNRWRVARTSSALVIVAVLALGVAKLAIGILRDRPVGFLVILCIITGYIALSFFKSHAPATSLGKQALKQLKEENAALEATARTEPQRLASGDVALALGLFGMSALAFADDSWIELRKALASSSSSSSSGSSCSSSSCGSSCGGGCGGGGCGGCGG